MDDILIYIAIGLVGISTLFTITLFILEKKLRRRVGETTLEFHHSSYSYYENLIKKEDLKQKAKIVTTAVDTGATIVEGIHKTISDISFKMMEDSPEKNATKEIHDTVSEAVYETIKGVNKTLGIIANGLIDIIGSPPSKKKDDEKKPPL